jgi:hypothetical protein
MTDHYALLRVTPSSLDSGLLTFVALPDGEPVPTSPGNAPDTLIPPQSGH